MTLQERKDTADIIAKRADVIVTIHHPTTTKEPKLHNKHYYDRTRSKRYLPSGRRSSSI